jgi:hypothetical protein
MPAQRKRSPSSPATDHATPDRRATRITPAVAARIRQLAGEARHRHAIAEFRARRAADQQTRVNALLAEAIAALATLLGAPDQPRHP